MTTIVNTPQAAPPPANDSSNSLGWLLTVLFVIGFFFLLMYYGLPMLRRVSSPPQVNIPDKVDVNVNVPDSP